MAKIRRVGAGALVSVAAVTPGTFVDIGVTIDVTPPAQVKADIEVTGQQDTVAQAVPGIEELSHFAFNEIWDGVTNTIDTLYAANSKVDWKIIFQGPATGSTEDMSITFQGYVSKLEPATVGGKDAVLRGVTVTRTGAITIGTT